MTRRNLPPEASQARPAQGDRMFAPASARNADALCDLLARFAPNFDPQADASPTPALEIASGTGQHIARFATQLPMFDWQPTEPDAARRRSIDSYVQGIANTSPARDLDATAPGWSARFPDRGLVVVVNLLHLISTPEAQTLVTEAAHALRPGGRFVIYGPFKRSGRLTSPGDEQFDATLRQSHPDIGYKNDTDMAIWLGASGLILVDTVDMPANNLAFVAARPGI